MQALKKVTISTIWDRRKKKLGIRTKMLNSHKVVEEKRNNRTTANGVRSIPKMLRNKARENIEHLLKRKETVQLPGKYGLTYQLKKNNLLSIQTGPNQKGRSQPKMHSHSCRQISIGKKSHLVWPQNMPEIQ